MHLNNQPWNLSGMVTRNATLEASFRQFLAVVVADHHLHARFLNMLSLLEHIGSRKIMLSQMRGTLAPDILAHLAEETRHAMFFKQQAGKLAGQPLVGYSADNTMTRAAAMMYFGRLDAGIAHTLSPTATSDDCYLWVSMIVELRACWVYRFYQEALQQIGGFSLRGIIAEEDAHLQQMYDALVAQGAQPEASIVEFSALETMLFQKLLPTLLAAAGVTNIDTIAA
jgi:hypothetical protein